MKLRNFAVGVGAAAMLIAGSSPALASNGGNNPSNDPHIETEKVRICHATASESHPYANDKHWVSWNSVDNGIEIDWNGHGDHEDDIIPPFGDFPGLNWTVENEATWTNGCTPVVTPPGEEEPPGEEPPALKDPVVTYGDVIDGTPKCDAEIVGTTQAVTTTPWKWDGDVQVPDTDAAVTIVVTGTRALDASEVIACPTEEPEPENPTPPAPPVTPPTPPAPPVTPPTPPAPPAAGLDTEVSPMCGADGPYLAYTVTVNDPAGKLNATTATLTFHHPSDSNLNWSVQVALGSGTVIWPGVSYSADGSVVTWPGWYWDVAAGTWVEDADANEGWTTAPDTEVSINVDPLVKTLTVTYPGDEPECEFTPTIAVVSDNVSETPTTPVVPTLSNTGVAPTKAAAAQPVKAAATYAG